MEACFQESVTTSALTSEKTAQDEGAEISSTVEHLTSEETTKQHTDRTPTAATDQETGLSAEQKGCDKCDNSSIISPEALKASANDTKIETEISAQPKVEDTQITSPSSEVVSSETKAERTEMDTYEEITNSEVTSLDDWEKVHKSCLSEIPPVDPEVLRDLELKACDIAGNLDHMLAMLANSLKAMSHVSMECLGAYGACVDHASETVDENIKSMYTLIARCEELNATLKPVQGMAEQVKEIKKTLDTFEAICK